MFIICVDSRDGGDMENERMSQEEVTMVQMPELAVVMSEIDGMSDEREVINVEGVYADALCEWEARELGRHMPGCLMEECFAGPFRVVFLNVPRLNKVKQYDECEGRPIMWLAQKVVNMTNQK